MALSRCARVPTAAPAPGAHERVRLEARPHAVSLVRPFGTAFVLAAGGALVLTRPWPFPLLGLVALVAAALRAVHGAWVWERTRLVVTQKRAVFVRGTLRRHSAAVALGRLARVEVQQTPLGRVLGYGTVIAGDLEIPHVARPAELARLLG